MSSHVKNREEVFWNVLYSIDRSGIVFGNAIVAAAGTFNKQMLAEEILYARLSNGITEYNQIKGGIFESVLLEKTGEEDLELYIYTTAE